VGSGHDLQREPFTSKPRLTDGGVYDNLALEAVLKRYDTVLISDGGGHIEAEAVSAADWPRHTYRVLQTIDSQVRALRMRAVLDLAKHDRRRKIAYWSVRSDVRTYPATGRLDAPHRDCLALAATPTRLSTLSASQQEALIDWGYAAADAAVRSFVGPGNGAPASYPYARGVCAT
jgi:NTE family protein